MAGQHQLTLSGKEIQRRLDYAVLYDKPEEGKGLSKDEQKQARENIGIYLEEIEQGGEGTPNAVRYDVDQGLEESQKAQARKNIGAISIEEIGQGGGEGTPNAVRYDEQDLGDTEQEQARKNIGVNDVVHYDKAQELTELQKLQARANIGITASFSHQEYFDIDDNGVLTVKKYDNIPVKLPSNLIIPDFVGGKMVKNLGDNIFMDNKDIVQVFLPNSVNKIPNGAFRGCENLTGLYNTFYITELGGGCLQKIGAETLIFPNLSTIGPAVFMGSASLKLVDIGLVTTLPFGVFKNCTNLTTVTGKGAVTSVGNEAFFNTQALEKVHFTKENLTSIGTDAFKDSKLESQFQQSE